MASEFAIDDRRLVVNSGVERGRDAVIERMRATADVANTNADSTPFATRGERLALVHASYSGNDVGHEAFRTELLIVVEANSDGKLVTQVMFDPDDINTAFEELDSRYMTGETPANAHAHAVVSAAYSALNRREIPPFAPNFVDIDHRPMAIESGNLLEYIRVAWRDSPLQASMYIEAVHKLCEHGTVVSHAADAVSYSGVKAEWRMTTLFMIEGDLLSRCEIFDEGDVDAALARFDELHSDEPRLNNAATHIWTRLADTYNRRDSDAFLSLASTDGSLFDKRKGIQSAQHGSAILGNLQAMLDVSPDSWRMTVEHIAVRGSKLSLTHARWVDEDQPGHPTTVELVGVMEVDDTGLIRENVAFDPDDIDEAFAELDARYLAGEAAGNQVWPEITASYAAMNRHEVPPTMAAWTTVDHRVRDTFEGGQLSDYARSAWDLIPDVKIHIEAVHRLTSRGALATHVARGTSHDGFEAEWRMIVILVKQINGPDRCELFEEADLAEATARFDEFSN